MLEECFPVGTTYRVIQNAPMCLGVRVKRAGRLSDIIRSFRSLPEARAWIVARREQTKRAERVL
jgi:hypothetical protein